MQPIMPPGMSPPMIAGPIHGMEPAAPSNFNFQDALLQAMGQVQGMNQQAQTSIENSLTGNDLTMVESFTAVREADLALRMMIQIRNKLLDAYQEIQQLRM